MGDPYKRAPYENEFQNPGSFASSPASLFSYISSPELGTGFIAVKRYKLFEGVSSGSSVLASRYIASGSGPTASALRDKLRRYLLQLKSWWQRAGLKVVPPVRLRVGRSKAWF